MTRNILLASLGLLIAGLLAIQLVPYRPHNPVVRQGPVWDSAETEALARRACFDCHSNEVVVPWYGHVAPFSWAVRMHVDEARTMLNFSEMDRKQEEAHEAGEEVGEGEMPPLYYVLLHPEANLTDAERRQLEAGLIATLGGEESEGSHSEGRHDRDVDDDDD
ncbi:MAG: mono/diheme cytochrome c family protein [Kiritimatiellia bacterium]